VCVFEGDRERRREREMEKCVCKKEKEVGRKYLKERKSVWGQT